MKKFIISVLLGAVLCSTACTQTTTGTATKNSLSAKEFQAAMEQPDILLIDVRTPQEYSSGHIAGSMNLDWTAKDYEQQFARLDRSKHLLLYCGIGGRSDQAREYLQDKGYQVQDLEDGIKGWKEAGLPVER